MRLELVQKTKTYKYLLYAIGEIFLVVIGILIALQVNNWNEERRERTIERDLLLELKEDLNETMADLKNDINTVNRTLAVTDSLYQDLFINTDSGDGPYKVPFWYTFIGASLYSKQSAYQSIQSRGVHIIKNPILRNAISDFYELFLNRIQSVEDGLHKIQDDELNPALNQNAIIFHDCMDCLTLPEKLYLGNQSPFDNKSYFIIKEPVPGLEQQLMKYYRTSNRLLILYQEAESVIQEIQRLIDSETNL
jgi:hypothetical protein